MNRRTTNAIRSVLDTCLPPIVRESRPFGWLTRIWLGRNGAVDFKYTAFRMNDRQFIDAYKALSGAYTDRGPDTTAAQASWLLQNIPDNSRVLEIGPGGRTLTRQLRAAGHQVITLDLDEKWATPGEVCIVGIAERLPLADKSVDVVVLSHVIEHVRSLTTTFVELARVTRGAVLIVTPRQRFYRVTFDYHLHFFYSLDHLASHIPCGHADGAILDGDLCLKWVPQP
jgi:2-polyprenyl-3-methyl-5-hydroxy-6-metoxy-1,4-benzoquinol methylase